jgi:hypothetical protein
MLRFRPPCDCLSHPSTAQRRRGWPVPTEPVPAEETELRREADGAAAAAAAATAAPLPLAEAAAEPGSKGAAIPPPKLAAYGGYRWAANATASGSGIAAAPAADADAEGAAAEAGGSGGSGSSSSCTKEDMAAVVLGCAALRCAALMDWTGLVGQPRPEHSTARERYYGSVSTNNIGSKCGLDSTSVLPKKPGRNFWTHAHKRTSTQAPPGSFCRA